MATISSAHFAADLSPSQALDWCAILVGAVHRLAWKGPDDGGDRQRCYDRLSGLLALAMAGDAQEQAIVTLADWWLAAAGLDGPAGVAWRPDAYLDDPDLARLMKSVLERGGLSACLRPRRFQAALTNLNELLEHVPRIKKAPGPEIYAEARDEAYSVLHAAEKGEDKPPGNLRLLVDDLQDWTSEQRGTDRLERNLKVWNALRKHLTSLRDAVRDVVGSWTTRTFTPEDLDLDCEAWAEQHFPQHKDLVSACLQDLAALTKRPPESRTASLDPACTLAALDLLPAGIELEQQVILLAPVREAVAAAGALTEPSWARGAQEHLESTRTTIRSLRAEAEALNVADSVQQLNEALEELEKLEIGEAQSWIQYARETLQEHVKDAKIAGLTRETSLWIADLEESAYDDIDALSAHPAESPQERHKRVKQTWEAHRDQLLIILDKLTVRARTGVGTDELRTRLEEVGHSLKQGHLGPARRLLDSAEALVEARWRAAEAKLRPELRALVERTQQLNSLYPSEREQLLDVITRATDRADDELPYEDLVGQIEAFIDACESDRLEEQPLLCAIGEIVGLERDRRVTPMAWSPTGVLVDSQRLAPKGYRLLEAEHAEHRQTGDLVVIHPRPGWTEPQRPTLALSTPPDAPPDEIWYDIVPARSLEGVDAEELRAYPGRHDLSPRTFIEAEGMVQGPYAADEESGRFVPADLRGFVARLDAEQFDSLFGRISIPMGAAGQQRLLTPQPPDLDTLLLQEAQPWDRMDETHVEVWLAGLLEDVDQARVRFLASALGRLESSGDLLPRAILEQRLSRLRGLLETSRHLDQERHRATSAFLETEEGKREIKRAAERRLELELAALQQAIETRRQELEVELTAKERALLEAQERLDGMEREELETRQAMNQRLADLQEQVEALESVADDTRTRVLASLIGQAAPSRSHANERPRVSSTPCKAQSFARRSFASLNELCTDIATGLAPWSDRQVANMLLCLISSPWLILAGPPGVGKSTFLRAVLASLGHGPGSDRYLELVVRRDWHDDAPLFGYWHPERHSWEPSSEGFVEQLLRARDDCERGLGGLFPFVLEEMNLAAPEYYLARPISALEDSSPAIRLYGETQYPENAERYPPSFAIGDNVRLLGTVNLDDTVERLSPRFLSRAAVIWMSPSLDALINQAPRISSPDSAVDWAHLLSLCQREPAQLGDLHKVVRYLHEQRVPGAPSPRTMRAMERYLSIATDLLPTRVAQDFQVLQRVLPCVRGVGERYRHVFDDLTALLRTHKWSMSAERCEELRARGEELGDYYDFFHV